MNITKEGRYILFIREDGKTAKYDLQTGDKISFTGRRVKSLAHFFRGTGTTLPARWMRYRQRNDEPLFPDEQNQRMFVWLQRKYPYHKALNSFLTLWAQNFDAEKWIAIGISPGRWDVVLDMKMIPKPLLKLKMDYSFYLNVNTLGPKVSMYIYEYYKKFKNPTVSLSSVFYSLWQFREIRDFSKHSLHLALNVVLDNPRNHYSIWEYRDCVTMAHQLGYRIQLADLTTREALRATHTLLQRDFQLQKDKIAEEKFLKYVTDKWDYEDENYRVSYPQTIQEITQEGQDMGHCVASYARNVDDQMSILFLRETSAPDTSFVTLERRGTELYQAKARHNHRPTDDTLKFLDKYCKIKKLNRRGY